MSGYSDGLFGASDINCAGTSTAFTNAAAIGTLVVGASASTMKFLAIGSAGSVLQSNAGADPTWVTSLGLTSLTLGTPLAAASGGTGNATYAIGDILYASGATALSRLADVATGNSLISGGVGVAPSWGKINLSTHTTGVLAAANGGTGLTAYTIGDLIYASGTSTLTALADVATGNALISGGVGVTPTWGKISLTTHVSGNLPIANGGTGSSAALTNGKIIVSVGGAMVEGTSSSTPSFSSATLTAGTNQLVLNSGQTITLNAVTPVASRVYTIPDALAAASFVLSEGTQRINGSKGFTAGNYWMGTDVSYAVGTASQTGTTITGSGTTWNASMVGGVILFANGILTFVEAFVSATSLTAAISQSVGSQAYTLYYGYTQMDNRGNIGTSQINISSIAGGLPVQTDAGKNLIGANINLASQVTGALPVANGGTGGTATPTNGGVAYGTGTALAFTAAGTSGQVLRSNGAAAPTWSTPADATAMWNLNSAAALIQNAYLGQRGSTSNLGFAIQIVPRAGTLTNLYFALTNAAGVAQNPGGTTKTWTATVYTNTGHGTAFSASTIVASVVGTNTVANSSNTVAMSAGYEFYIFITQANNPNSVNGFVALSLA